MAANFFGSARVSAEQVDDDRHREQEPEGGEAGREEPHRRPLLRKRTVQELDHRLGGRARGVDQVILDVPLRQGRVDTRR